MALPTRAEYERQIYALPQDYLAVIASSTLRLYTRGPLTARIEGDIHFTNGLTLRVREFVDLRLARILDYSYTIWRGDERVRWYDPQPHPEQPALKATFPHHRHEPPAPSAESEMTIKHNRRPAPGISFESSNLGTLIADCIELGKSLGLG